MNFSLDFVLENLKAKSFNELQKAPEQCSENVATRSGTIQHIYRQF